MPTMSDSRMRLTFDDDDLTVTLVEQCDSDISRDAHLARLFARILRLVEPAQMGLVLASIVRRAVDGMETHEEDEALIHAANRLIQYWSKEGP